MVSVVGFTLVEMGQGRWVALWQSLDVLFLKIVANMLKVLECCYE
jgi:hypothetical protein